MSDLEFFIRLFGPAVVALLLAGVFAWIWITPTADGNVDGAWGNRMHAHRYSGLRLRVYNRAHRKNYKERNHSNV